MVDQLVEEAEQIRERRSERAHLLHAIDGQLARVDAAVRALRGQHSRGVSTKSVNIANPGVAGGRVMKVRGNGNIVYAPGEETLEKVRAALREHGQTPQKDLPALSGVGMGTIHRARMVLEERGEIEVIQPRKRPAGQTAGRVSPELRLL